MSELKRFDVVGKYRDEETMYEFRPDGECYDADEVDKAIADLEEAHKMEVGQLLVANREQAINANRLRDSMEQAIRRQKYERCVTKAEMCSAKCDKWMMKKANAIGLGKDGVEYYLEARRKVSHYMGWQRRWLKIAEKFKGSGL